MFGEIYVNKVRNIFWDYMEIKTDFGELWCDIIIVILSNFLAVIIENIGIIVLLITSLLNAIFSKRFS